MAMMSGGEALARSLAGEGVEVVFGIPGIQIYGIVAALRDEPGIRLISTRHEQATTYMADGYARASGRPGVALVVPGVGPVQLCVGIDQCVFALLAGAADSGPDPPRRHRKGPRGRSRNREPVRGSEFRYQVAAAGVKAEGSPGGRVRSVQADAHRASPSGSHRNSSGGRSGAGGSAAAKPGKDIPHSAQPR